MFLIVKNLIILVYLNILLCSTCAELPNNNEVIPITEVSTDGIKNPTDIEQYVEMAISALKFYLRKANYLNPSFGNNREAEDFIMSVHGQQIRQTSIAENKKQILMRDLEALKYKMKIADDNAMLTIWRFLIDDYEESFPQSYEPDFEKKKVKYDQLKLANLRGYDLIEERRRQKWLFYCKAPPNKKMTDLVKALKKEKIDLDTFSSGTAKACRLLSDKFLSGVFPTIKEDPKVYFFIFKNVAIAVRMLLTQGDLLVVPNEWIEQTVPKH